MTQKHNPDTQHALLGMSAARFLSDYWQQQPVVLHTPYEQSDNPLSANELAGLALEEDVEARLITQQNADWQLRHSPFTEADFLSTPERDWTLLVQAVDLWVPAVADLKQRFDFLPAWRLDDIMVSYAAPGGSVGPHFDHYDVFLLQLEGQRRWQLGAPCPADEPLREESDLRLLAHFDPIEEHLLGPGDMLYLPPRIPHWGIATEACMTYSIGFRAPTLVEMLDDLIIDLISAEHDPHYQDPPLREDMSGVDIDPAFVAQARMLLRDILDDEQRLGEWFARYMTAPKYPNLVTESGEQRVARWRNTTYVNGNAQGKSSDLD